MASAERNVAAGIWQFSLSIGSLVSATHVTKFSYLVQLCRKSDVKKLATSSRSTTWVTFRRSHSLLFYAPKFHKLYVSTLIFFLAKFVTINIFYLLFLTSPSVLTKYKHFFVVLLSCCSSVTSTYFLRLLMQRFSFLFWVASGAWLILEIVFRFILGLLSVKFPKVSSQVLSANCWVLLARAICTAHQPQLSLSNIRLMKLCPWSMKTEDYLRQGQNIWGCRLMPQVLFVFIDISPLYSGMFFVACLLMPENMLKIW